MRGWGAVLKGEAVGLGSWGGLRCRVAVTSLALQCQPPSVKQNEPPCDLISLGNVASSVGCVSKLRTSN